MKKTLFLHIGHGKTGSSYLQSVFVNSRQTLADNRIFYPEDPSDEQALSGKISFGNGMLLSGILNESPTPVESQADEACKEHQSVLFSSEWLFNVLNEVPDKMWENTPWRQPWTGLSGKEKVQILKQWAQARGFERISVLLFIRNPVSQCISWHQQCTKNHGEFLEIEQKKIHYAWTREVLSCLQLLKPDPEIELTVRNYSVVSTHLSEVAADWLGISESSLIRPPAKTVNRSMTYSELALQRCFNKHLGATGWLLSEPLCNALPDIAVKKSYPSMVWQKQFWQEQLPIIEKVNAMVDPEHHYRFDGKDASNASGDYTFSGEQLDVIAENVSNHILYLSEKLDTSKKKNQELKEKLESKRAEIRQMKQRKNWFKKLLSK